MSDNVSVEAVKQVVQHGNGGVSHPSPMASEAPAASQQDLAQWQQQVMQAYYKQQQQPQGQQTAFYPAAAHPYAGFFAGQPLMYGAPFYGGIVPYTYPAPAAPGVQGPESSAKIEKAVSSQPMAIANGSTGATLASLPPRGSQSSQAQRLNLHSKASSNSLNALSESGQYAKQSPNCTPPASPVQPPPAEPSKDKILHASDAEGIKAEGQAAAMAAIAAAQAQVNGQGRDDTRGNSGEYWVRSNSEEDMERADSGGLQDEREVKRQRRKQSNRESARRSRLRKQAECEALAVRVNELMNENVKLRAANEQLLKLQHMTSHQVAETGKA